MCTFVDTFEKRGIEIGMAWGISQGISRGIAMSVERIVEKQKCSLAEACELLGITIEEYQKTKDIFYDKKG